MGNRVLLTCRGCPLPCPVGSLLVCHPSCADSDKAAMWVLVARARHKLERILVACTTPLAACATFSTGKDPLLAQSRPPCRYIGWGCDSATGCLFQCQLRQRSFADTKHAAMFSSTTAGLRRHLKLGALPAAEARLFTERQACV